MTCVHYLVPTYTSQSTQLHIMTLLSELNNDSAKELYNQGEYISIPFHCRYNRVPITNTDIQHFSYNLIDVTYSYVNSSKISLNGKKLDTAVTDSYGILDLIKQYGIETRYYISQLNDNEDSELIVFIDMNFFNQYYATNFKLDGSMITIIRQYALNKYKVLNFRDCNDDPIVPINSTQDFKLQLHPHQIRSLSWMETCEQGTPLVVPTRCFYRLGNSPNNSGSVTIPTSGSVTTPTSAYINLLITDNKHDPSNNVVFRNEYPESDTLVCRGWLLSDAPGMGKTISCISHIHRCQAQQPALLTTMIEREIYLASKATLIVVPVNLFSNQQWDQEFIKQLGPNVGGLRILRVNSLLQMRKLSLQDVLTADVIITTYDWLAHANHIGKQFCRAGGFNLLNQQREYRARYGTDYAKYSSWSLILIKYHRIIYDELHEVIQKTNVNNILLNVLTHYMSARNIGVVTASYKLFELKPVIENLMKIMNVRDSFGHEVKPNPIAMKYFLDHYARRNHIIELPPLTHHLVNIQQTLSERQIYEASATKSTAERLQYCGYVGLGSGSNRKTLGSQSIEEIANTYQIQRETELTKYQNDVLFLTQSQLQLESVILRFDSKAKTVDDLMYYITPMHPKHTSALIAQIKNSQNLQNLVKYLKDYSNYTKRIDNLKADIAKLEACIQYYKNSLKQATSGFVCPITGEVCNDSEIVISSNGDLFGREAIEMLFEASPNGISCPITQKTLSRRDFTVVSNTNTSTSTSTSTISTDEQLYGTKITAMLKIIQSLKPTEKVIIASEWESLLDLISEALDAHQIKNVLLKGSHYTRGHALNDFKTQPQTRVLLLSSRFSASGLHLVEATHVFLANQFHNLVGHQYQEQTIKRAHRQGQTQEVKVYHFVTQNTVESDLYQLNLKAWGNSQ
jgi:SNF2 family DNA or RNA helicase